MTDGFGELGLRDELLAAVRRAGYEDPTPLQRAAIPVIRRGANAVLRGSSGAGVTAAYGLPLLERLAASGASQTLRALVIVPSMDRASAVARTLATLGMGTGLHVRAFAPGWRRGSTDIIVASAEAVLRALRDSALKLDSLEVLAVEGASMVLAGEADEEIETLMVTVPASAQRVVTTAEMTKRVEHFVQAHVRKAMEIPPRPADPALVAPPAPRGKLSYVIVQDAAKPEVLAELLGRSSDTPAAVITRTSERAESVRAELALRGFAVSGESSEESGISVLGALDAPRATIAYDVPADARVLERMEPESGVVMVEPAELPHLRTLAADTGFELAALARRARRGQVPAYRERIRRALREEDLDAQLLLLEPLFDEAPAAEVAAALSALLRTRGPAPPPEATAPDTLEGKRPPPFVRVFVSIGQRDGLRPADIVGAFTGEAGIKGEQIGRIEIRDTFTVVELDAGAAERVIRALNGTTMRGRSIRVDFDRKTSATPRRSRPMRT